jgi:hypothetical protein
VSYKVELSEAAQADLARMPAPLQNFVVRSLRRIESNPEGESKSTTGLYAKGFIFELEYAQGDLDIYVDVLFRYRSAPSQIEVFKIHWEYV